MNNGTYFEKDLKADPAEILPPEVKTALLTLAKFSRESGMEFRFGWVHYSKYGTMEYQSQPHIMIENVSRKLANRCINSDARPGCTSRYTEFPELNLSNYALGGVSPVWLSIKFDREDNAKKAVEHEAKNKDDRHAAALARHLLKEMWEEEPRVASLDEALNSGDGVYRP